MNFLIDTRFIQKCIINNKTRYITKIIKNITIHTREF